MIDITPLGDQALIIQFEDRIDPKIHAQLSAIFHDLVGRNIEGITGCWSAYTSITVTYDPHLWRFSDLQERLMRFGAKHKAMVDLDVSRRKVKVPVCYSDSFALDRKEVQCQTGLDWEEIVGLHTNTTFRVYMIGFLPGFPYLGLSPVELTCPRKEVPRIDVPAQSVGLAGRQSGIYPMSSPGGWQIIGRTPVKPFDVHRKRQFAFEIGDEVTFFSITQDHFANLSQIWGDHPDQTSQIYE